MNLDRSAIACRYYEEMAIASPARIVAGPAKVNAPKTKLSWSFFMTLIGLWVCIIWVMHVGEYRLGFDMMVVLSLLWAGSFAREISADLIKGKVRLSR